MNALPLVGDCRSIPLPDGSVDAVVTDPPYGLAFMGKAWDHDVPGPDYWREVYRVMKPGAHLLAFGGTRTWHWLTVGIEEAGFEIRDCLSWNYGTGFPKSHDISKAIDKAAGAEREVVGVDEYRARRIPNGRNTEDTGDWNYGTDQRQGDDFKITAPATEEAERWDGWGTALKPAWEPIVLAMKPTDGTFAENALTHGVAGLNVDGCRISHDEECRMLPDQHGDEPGDFYQQGGRHGETMELKPDGRWPANVTLSHTRWCRRRGTKRVEAEQMGSSGGDPDGHGIYNEGFPRGDGRKQDYADEDGKEEVEDWDCPPSCPVRQLDEQSGERPVPGSYETDPDREENVYGEDSRRGGEWRKGYGDTGGASRFYYCAKASRGEREAGLPDVEGRANSHPTVKPIDLCRWLVRLVTRKGHLVLDPFMGSGSIGCAALQERRRYIGLDLEPEYVEIARARLEHWAPKQVDLFKDAEA